MFGKIISKLREISFEEAIFYLFVFSMPFQTRLILYKFDYAFDEFKSIFLYLTDILIFLMIALWASRWKRSGASWRDLFSYGYIKALILFIVIAAASIAVAYNKYLSLYQLIKLVELAAMFLYVLVNSKILKLNNILLIIVGSGFFQSIIALLQFTFQRSINLKILGETVFNQDTIGIARINTPFGNLIRAYGTFPHSNVFASFIVLSVFCSVVLLFRSSSFWKSFAISFTMFFMILGLALSFSRENILTFVVILLVYFLFLLFSLRAERVKGELDDNSNKENSKKLLIVFLVVMTFISFMGLMLAREYTARLNISLQEQALDLRFFYNGAGLEIIKEKPFLGVGIGDFTLALKDHEAFLRAAKKMTEMFGGGVYVKEAGGKIAPWLFQPAHNIYILVASEVGVVGALAFIIFIILVLKAAAFSYLKSNFNKKVVIASLLAVVLTFLVAGMADHYFWTLQQGRLMFWFTLGLLAAVSANE